LRRRYVNRSDDPINSVKAMKVTEVTVEFNAPPNTIYVIAEVDFKANHLTDTDMQNSTGKYTN